ncbi:HxlR family transcriptional regulator [Myxococcus stipitatus DSM 14675]|uniref:HxlR family transcriptional regulator n=1 Tax=Myxococcus stipitatus (strain DSM 14675 / JCM 12634 / Mx s8) TaxID=1278073 RepID=L7U429_MYXSD|nr:helix-turn-helix domain-containing protein [Myxococcus stipitatus]AGC43526.1 HxlR family transcriptional regulator [Myxococcus stipitatus DSM 14675]
MVRRSTPRDCGLHAALSVIGGKWKSPILCELHHGPTRFAELKRRVFGISEKVLFEQLRELEATGVVHRTVLDPEPPKVVEYSLTPTGMALTEAVRTLVEWGRAHASHVRGFPEPIDSK